MQVRSRTQTTKKIAVKSLADNAAAAGGLAALAAEIVEKCKLIHPSKGPAVEALLHQLLERSAAAAGLSGSIGSWHADAPIAAAESLSSSRQRSREQQPAASPTQQYGGYPDQQPSSSSTATEQNRRTSSGRASARAEHGHSPGTPTSSQQRAQHREQPHQQQQRGKLGRLVAAADAAIAAEEEGDGLVDMGSELANGQGSSSGPALLQLPVMLAKQYEPARMEDLDDYIVSGTFSTICRV
jgi:hypothetical protein